MVPRSYGDRDESLDQRFLRRRATRFFCFALKSASERLSAHWGCSPEREYEIIPHTGQNLRTEGK
jgi:hypothetical protein